MKPLCLGGSTTSQSKRSELGICADRDRPGQRTPNQLSPEIWSTSKQPNRDHIKFTSTKRDHIKLTRAGFATVPRMIRLHFQGIEIPLAAVLVFLLRYFKVIQRVESLSQSRPKYHQPSRFNMCEAKEFGTKTGGPKYRRCPVGQVHLPKSKASGLVDASELLADKLRGSTAGKAHLSHRDFQESARIQSVAKSAPR